MAVRQWFDKNSTGWLAKLLDEWCSKNDITWQQLPVRLWYSRNEGGWLQKLLEGWSSKNSDRWYVRLLQAFWDSAIYTWDSAVCPWDADSEEKWYNKITAGWRSAAGSSWMSKNNTDWKD